MSIPSVGQAIIYLIIMPIIALWLYISIKGYFYNIIAGRIEGRFRSSRTLAQNVFDLWMAYSVLALTMEFFIYIYLKLNMDYDTPLNESQSLIASALIGSLILISRFRVGHKDPFKFIGIFLNTIIVLIVMNLIVNVEILPSDLSSWYSFLENNIIGDFLIFAKDTIMPMYIGSIGLVLIGETILKLLKP